MIHKTTEIILNDEKVNIDNNIVEMIKLLNDYGLKTDACCEYDTYRNGIFILFNKSVTDEVMNKFLDEFKLFHNLCNIKRGHTINNKYEWIINPDDYIYLLESLYDKLKPGYQYVEYYGTYKYGYIEPLTNEYDSIIKDLITLRDRKIISKEVNIRELIEDKYGEYLIKNPNGLNLYSLAFRINDRFYLEDDKDNLLMFKTREDCENYFKERDSKCNS